MSNIKEHRDALMDLIVVADDVVPKNVRNCKRFVTVEATVPRSLQPKGKSINSCQRSSAYAPSQIDASNGTGRPPAYQLENSRRKATNDGGGHSRDIGSHALQEPFTQVDPSAILSVPLWQQTSERAGFSLNSHLLNECSGPKVSI
jgi:hypothetical protein